MEIETIVDQSIPFKSFFLKFDTNQHFSKEIQVCSYCELQSDTTNPFNDIPVKKTIYLNRLPPWTDPENLKNLMCRISGEANVKVCIKCNRPNRRNCDFYQLRNMKIT